MYYEDIRKFGNDPNSVGVDGILKKYAAKYKEYDDLYGKTLDLLEKVQTPAQPVSFEYTNRKGVEETISGTMEEILQDRKKLLPYLSSTFKGMDADISTEVAKFRTAIFVNPDYASKFKGYLKKYKSSGAISPRIFLRILPSPPFSAGSSGGQRALELRMRATLDRVGSTAGRQLLTPKKRLSRCEPRGSCLDGRKAHRPKFDRGCSSGHGAVDPSFRGYRWRISF